MSLFKKLRTKLREKLELDNPDKYINGYYQLSNKQKKLWVLGLFLVAWVFAVVKVIFLGEKHYLFDVMLIGSIVGTISIMGVSLFPAYLYYVAASLFRDKFLYNKIITKITLYQLWTLFLVAVILAIISKIKLSVIFPLLQWS